MIYLVVLLIMLAAGLLLYIILDRERQRDRERKWRESYQLARIEAARRDREQATERLRAHAASNARRNTRPPAA